MTQTVAWGYSLKQTIESFSIIFDKLALGIESDQILVKCTQDGLLITLDHEILIKGTTFGSVVPDSCTWLLESTNPSFKSLSVFIDKQEPIIWPIFIKSGLKSAHPSELDAHSLYILATSVLAHDPNTSLKLFKYAADHGDIAALLKLGAWFHFGKEEVPDVIPVEKDQQEALKYHTIAARLGSAEACYFLMSSNIHGSNGLNKSYSDAAEWGNLGLAQPLLKEEQPDIYTQLNWELGLLYSKLIILKHQVEGGHGLGDPVPAKSLEYWKVSSDAGHAHSLWNSGIFYFNGFGTIQDIINGIQMIQNGMKLNPDLKLPPQLSNMSQNQLSILIQLASKSEVYKFTLDIDQLDQLIKIAQDSRVLGMSPQTLKTLAETINRHLSENKLNAEKILSFTLKKTSKKQNLCVSTKSYSLASSHALWIGGPIVLFGLYSLAKSRKWI